MILKNLHDLVMLLSVAESKGFSAAAKRHNMAPATLSKQIARIEKQLGVRLFDRNTRYLEITTEGQQFVDRIREALEIIDNAESAIKQPNELCGLLSITAPLLLGQHFIAPIVDAFHKVHPQLHIDLRLTDHVIDLYSQGVDIAIRVGKLTDSNLIAKQFTVNQRILVAAPEYLKDKAVLTHPNDLAAHQCLLFSYPGFRQNRWTLCHQQSFNNKQTINVSGHLSSDNGEALKQWCLSGKGIALRETWEVNQYIKEGKLIHLLPEWKEPESTISVLYKQRQNSPIKITMFINYLTQHWHKFTQYNM